MPNSYGINDGTKEFEFICACCGKPQRGSPAYGYDKPIDYFDIPENERGDRVQHDTDTCVIDRDQHYIKCTLDIPIIGAEEPLCWGVWIKLTAPAFKAYWKGIGADQSSFKEVGWLDCTLPGYNDLDRDGNLITLEVDVVGNPAGLRPSVYLRDRDHPLVRDQQNGLSWAQAKAYVSAMPH